MGIVKHLPDPPVKKPHFDSDKVNSSKEAYSYGMPDGPLTIAAHATSIAIAAAGPPDRVETCLRRSFNSKFKGAMLLR